MNGETIGQGAVVVLVVAIVAAVVAGAIVYVIKPTPLPPEIAELQAAIDEQAATISELEATVTDLESQLGTKPGKGIKLDFVLNGSLGDPAWSPFEKGVNDAASYLGVSAITHYYEEDPAKAVTIMDTLIAAKPDGIAISVTQPNALRPKIQEAINAGIPVITVLADDNESARMGYIGYEGGYYAHGYRFAQDFASMIPDGSHILCAEEVLGSSYHIAKTSGFVDGLRDAGVNFTYDELDAGYELATCEANITAYLLGHPETDVIFGVGGLTTDRACASLIALGKAPGEIILLGHDLSPTTIDGMKKGYCQGVIAASFYFTAYQSVNAMFLHAKYAHDLYDIPAAGPFTITPEILPTIEEYAEEGIY